MAQTSTTTKRFAELLLGEPLDLWILSRRVGDEKTRSWRSIADELREITGGEVNVAPETMRLWGTEALEQAS
jgi:hypothetical protein